MKNIILIILILFTLNLSYAQWIEIDIDTEETLNQIYFINNDIGYIAGNNGQLFGTTNGGDSWLSINISSSHNLFTVSFANENVGFINGLKTIDGGITWSSQTTSEDFGLIHALDENNLIAGLADNFSGDIYKSSDGGDSWEVIANPISPLAGAYNDVCFVNDELGFLSAWYSNHLVKTVDGGENWTEIEIDIVDGVNFVSDDFRSVDFPTQETGLVTHQNGILKTIDAGNTWSEIKPQGLSTSFYPESIIALSTENYIVVGGFQGNELEKIYETSDGGTTWSESVNTTDALFDINCNSMNCFSVGSNGKVYKKENIVNNILENFGHFTFYSYPNPAKDIFSIETNLDITEIRILNIEGKLIDSISENNDIIDVSYLHSGLFLIKIISNEGIFTYKFIKE